MPVHFPHLLPSSLSSNPSLLPVHHLHRQHLGSTPYSHNNNTVTRGTSALKRSLTRSFRESIQFRRLLQIKNLDLHLYLSHLREKRLLSNYNKDKSQSTKIEPRLLNREELRKLDPLPLLSTSPSMVYRIMSTSRGDRHHRVGARQR